MKVFITGDTHGRVADFRRLADFALNENLTENDVIVIMGDVGIYYGGITYGSGRKIMKQVPCKFLVIRGNHDDRIKDVIAASEKQDRWGQQQLLGNSVYVDKRYPNVLYALDEGGLYEIQGEKVLIVPGAYSVDKFYRLAHQLPYNPDEQLTIREMDNLLQVAEDNPDITGVIAHTAPLSWESYFRDLFFSGIDQDEVDKTTDRFLDALIERLPNLKHYYFGHFHDNLNCGEYGVMLYHGIVEYGARWGEVVEGNSRS